MQSWIVTTERHGVSARQHVVRRVEQIRLLPAQVERQRDLLAHRVLRRPCRNRPEVLAELGRERGVLVTAQDDVFVLLIQPREVAQQVADVGADPVVAQLPGVDGDSHANRILSRHSHFARLHASRYGWQAASAASGDAIAAVVAF